MNTHTCEYVCTHINAHMRVLCLYSLFYFFYFMHVSFPPEKEILQTVWLIGMTRTEASCFTQPEHLLKELV